MKRRVAILLVIVLCLSAVLPGLADTIHIPSGVKIIDEESFYGDTSLDVVDIPWGTEKIGERAFANSGVSKVYIPDTVENIAENAFSNTNVTVVSSYDSFAHDYSKNNNISWINSNGDENEESHDNTEFESYLLDKIDQISLSEATDDDMTRKIEEYNELCSQVNDLIDQYNESLLELNEAVNALYEEISIEETNDNIIIGLDDYQFVIDSNAYKHNLENAEIIDEENVSDVVIKCQDGHLLYLSSNNNQVIISSQPTELVSRAIEDDNTPNFYEKANTIVQRVSTCAVTTGSIIDVLEQKLPILKKDIPIGGAKKIEANLAKLISKQGISSVLDSLPIVSDLVSIGYDQDKILKLYKIKTHGHPTDGEDDQTSLDICIHMYRELQTAVKMYVIDQCMCYASAISSSFFVGRNNILKRFLGIILGFSEWGTADIANRLYNSVMRYDGMLHYAIEGNVWNEETKQLLSGVTVRCKTEGFEDKITKTDKDGHFYIEPLSDIVSLEISDNEYATKSITVYISDYDVPEVCNISLRKKTAYVHGIVKDTDTGLPIAGAYFGTEYDITQTDTNGFYRFEMNPGRYKIYYSADKYEAKSFDWTFEQDQDIEINLTLKKTVNSNNSEQNAVKVCVPISVFRDPILREYVSNNFDQFKPVYYDTEIEDWIYEQDNYLTEDELEGVVSLAIPSGVASLAGIKYFYNLSILSFEGKISYVDVSGCVALKTINARDKGISHIVLTGCTSLISLDVSKNRLGSLNLSDNSALQTLDCSGNRITNLQIANCTVLSTLNCRDNQLYGLDILPCTLLKTLDCSNNLFSNLVISGHNTIESVYCSSDSLKELYAHNCPALLNIYYDGNALKHVDLSGCSMMKVIPSISSMVYLDVSECESLEIRTLTNSNLKTIIAKNGKAENGIEFICPKLISLDLEGKKIQRCDLNCPNLSTLNINDTEVEHLSCEEVDRLELSDNESLREVSICKGYSIVLNGLKMLEKVTSSDLAINEINISNCESLKEIYLMDGAVSKLSAINCTSLSYINFRDNIIESSLDVSGCIALQELYCPNAKLTNLIINGCTALEGLFCNNNNLSSLDISTCKSLKYLDCSNNKIVEINYDGVESLVSVSCGSDTIEAISIKNCSAFIRLDASGMKLRSIDISGCTGLTTAFVVIPDSVEYVNVSRCNFIPILGAGVRTLIAQNNQIQSANINGSSLKFADFENCLQLQSLTLDAPELESLNIDGCNSLGNLICNGHYWFQ